MISNVFAECAIVGSLERAQQMYVGFDEKTKGKFIKIMTGLRNHNDVKHWSE